MSSDEGDGLRSLIPPWVIHVRETRPVGAQEEPGASRRDNPENSDAHEEVEQCFGHHATSWTRCGALVSMSVNTVMSVDRGSTGRKREAL